MHIYNMFSIVWSLWQKWWSSVDGSGQAGALLTDLSNAFDCIVHELLIAKVHA